MKAWRPPRSSFKGKVRYPDPINESLQKAALKARYAIRTLLMKGFPEGSLKGKVRYPDPINEGLEAAQKVVLEARYAIQTLLMKARRPPRRQP